MNTRYKIEYLINMLSTIPNMVNPTDRMRIVVIACEYLENNHSLPNDERKNLDILYDKYTESVSMN